MESSMSLTPIDSRCTGITPDEPTPLPPAPTPTPPEGSPAPQPKPADPPLPCVKDDSYFTTAPVSVLLTELLTPKALAGPAICCAPYPSDDSALTLPKVSVTDTSCHQEVLRSGAAAGALIGGGVGLFGGLPGVAAGVLIGFPAGGFAGLFFVEPFYCS